MGKTEEVAVDVVSVEVATDTVNSWISAKRLPKSKSESDEFKMFKETLIEAVTQGTLSLEEDMTWTHKLVFPIKDEHGQTTKDKLTYKLRINDVDKNKYRKSVTKDDGALMLTLLALTGESKGIINLLDSSTDRSLADAIALFFL